MKKILIIAALLSYSSMATAGEFNPVLDIGDDAPKWEKLPSITDKEIAFDHFKKHKVEPIIFNFRHRYFWDGGIHCITQDLYREGKQEDYFA